MATIVMPSSITQGDTLRAVVTFSEGRSISGGDSIRLVVRKGHSVISGDAEQSGDDVVVALSPEYTQKATQGTYQYQAKEIEASGHVTTFAVGSIDILPNLETSDTRAFRPLGDLLVDVEAAISAVMKNQEYTIDSMTYKKADLAILYRMRKDLIDKIELYGPDHKEGGGGAKAPRIVQACF